MLMIGYKKHEIRYIREYARVIGISEQQAITQLGIGTLDRMAAATALWKGLPWLPMNASKTLDVKFLRPFALNPEEWETAPRAVPIAQKGNVFLYATYEPAVIGDLDSRLYVIERQMIGWVSTLKNINSGLRLGQMLVSAGVLKEDNLSVAVEEQARLREMGTNILFGEVLTRFGFVSEKIINEILKHQKGEPLSSESEFSGRFSAQLSHYHHGYC